MVFSLMPSSLPPTVYIISLILLGGRKEKREEYRIKEKGVKRGKGMWRGKGGEGGEEGKEEREWKALHPQSGLGDS